MYCCAQGTSSARTRTTQRRPSGSTASRPASSDGLKFNRSGFSCFPQCQYSLIVRMHGCEFIHDVLLNMTPCRPSTDCSQRAPSLLTAGQPCTAIQNSDAVNEILAWLVTSSLHHEGQQALYRLLWAVK